MRKGVKREYVREGWLFEIFIPLLSLYKPEHSGPVFFDSIFFLTL